MSKATCIAILAVLALAGSAQADPGKRQGRHIGPPPVEAGLNKNRVDTGNGATRYIQSEKDSFEGVIYKGAAPSASIGLPMPSAAQPQEDRLPEQL